jgi:hypothetical protein
VRKRNVINGSEAVLEIYDDKAVILDANFSSNPEERQAKALLYSDLSGTSLEMASPGAIGQIIFHTAPKPDRLAGKRTTETAFTFPFSENALATEVCEFIERQIKRVDFSTSAISKLAISGQMLELTMKLSSGELTMEEFEIERRKLLKRP